jgi:hypothetical protein
VYGRGVDAQPRSRLGRHLGSGTRDATGAEILEADDEVAPDELERCLDEQLLRERVTDLDRGTFLERPLVELGRRQHARPADAVAPGAGAEQHDRVPLALRRPTHELFLDNAEASCVDQRVGRVAVLEHGLATHGGHTDRVPVGGNAVHDAVDEIRRLGVVGGAEAQRVHKGDRPRSHRKDVAHDAAHAGCGSVVGLDERGVVVRFDLPGDGNAGGNLDDARSLAGADEDVGTFVREVLEVDAARLIRAVLAPHDREHRQFHEGRRAPEARLDGLELVVG